MPPSFLGEVGGNEGEITRNVRRSRVLTTLDGGGMAAFTCFDSAPAPFIFVTWVVGRRKRIEGEREAGRCLSA